MRNWTERGVSVKALVDLVSGQCRAEPLRSRSPRMEAFSGRVAGATADEASGYEAEVFNFLFDNRKPLGIRNVFKFTGLLMDGAVELADGSRLSFRSGRGHGLRARAMLEKRRRRRLRPSTSLLRLPPQLDRRGRKLVRAAMPNAGDHRSACRWHQRERSKTDEHESSRLPREALLVHGAARGRTRQVVLPVRPCRVAESNHPVSASERSPVGDVMRSCHSCETVLSRT